MNYNKKTIYPLLVEKLSANYGANNIIEDIDFYVQPNESFGVMGLNGVGKTTLIKILLGLMPPSSGEAKIFGKKILNKEAKKKIAYLPEKFEPPAFLTGMEFIKFSLSLYGTKFNEDEVLLAADRLALDRDALFKKVNTYSKGMKQKTGLLGTLLTKCPLLILDEPMSGLDPKARVCVKDEIIKCKKQKMTIFLSSHILADMEEICDRVAIIDSKKLQFLGTPQKLKEKTEENYLERAFLKKIGLNVSSNRKVI